MQNEIDFYLASSEGYNLEKPRKCQRMVRLKNESRDNLLLIKIDPPIVGQQYGLGSKDIDEIIIATRFKNESLFPIQKWPIHVYVLRPLINISSDTKEIKNENMKLIAWAELYPDEVSARKKSVSENS